MVPSALIDVGWHAWVLHTVDYAEYCDRIGRFVHRVFCKGVRADRPYAWTHRNEAAVAPFLPASLAPALLWSFVQDGWHMLGFEYVPGRYPSLSPTSGDLDVIGDLVVTMAEALTPCPSAALHSIADRWGAAPGWAAVYAKLPTDLDPWARAHIGVLAMLERGAFLDGDTLVHSDLHPANMLTRDDRVSLLRFDGHLRCGGQAASAASYSTGVR
ncbi:phosphotransferase [Embleya sp. NPDC005575]|uniref:phosphotransferase n=1 Tax=Embleya sp. NPDC005575 TaxID=3156892 RepID=UPI0033A4BC89